MFIGGKTAHGGHKGDIRLRHLVGEYEGMGGPSPLDFILNIRVRSL